MHERGAIRLSGLTGTPGSAQQVRARRVEQVVPTELIASAEAVDQLEPDLEAVGHRHGDGTVGERFAPNPLKVRAEGR